MVHASTKSQQKYLSLKRKRSQTIHYDGVPAEKQTNSTKHHERMHLQDATNRYNNEQSAASNPLAAMHSSVRTPSYPENSLRDVPSGKTVPLKYLLSQTPSSAQATCHANPALVSSTHDQKSTLSEVVSSTTTPTLSSTNRTSATSTQQKLNLTVSVSSTTMPIMSSGSLNQLVNPTSSLAATSTPEKPVTVHSTAGPTMSPANLLNPVSTTVSIQAHEMTSKTTSSVSTALGTCSYSTSQSNSTRAHADHSTCSLSCNYFGKVYSHKSSLSRHISTAHSHEKGSVQCQSCGLR